VQNLGSFLQTDKHMDAAATNSPAKPGFPHIVDGLEHVIGRRLLEGADRVFVVGGHEHHQRERLVAIPALAQLLGRLQPALSRHFNVEEEHIRPGLERAFDDVDAVRAGRDDLELWPPRPTCHGYCRGSATCRPRPCPGPA
jgi:hypothetical protein